MSLNHLEQMIGEWYEWRGFFVRRNIHVGKRSAGGYECELDIVALDPRHKRLVHVEPSTDADSWQKREARYKKKFEAGRKYIPKLFAGLDLPPEIEQIAVFLYASKSKHEMIAGGTVKTARDVLKEIVSDLKGMSIARAAIPEQFPILRTVQLLNEFSRELWTS